MKKAIALILAVVFALSLVACAGSSSGSTEAAKTETATKPSTDTTAATTETAPQVDPAEATKGGTLVIGIRRDNTHDMLNFHLTGAGDDYYYSWPVYESLFRPNAEGGVDPWLLEDYEMHNDELYYLFKVRPGITFSDGTPFDGEALKWNLDHYLEVGQRVVALLPQVTGTELVDDMTVKLNLSEWNSNIPYAYSREPGYMFSPTFYNEHGEEYCAEHPCGTGAFVLTDWTHDVSKTFEKRNDYWGGEVNLDAVKYVVMADMQVASLALMSGDIDVLLAPPTETAVQLQEQGVPIKIAPVKSSDYLLVFNSLNTDGDDPTGNVLVRKAISYAINEEELVEAVWGDFASVRNQFGVGEFFKSDSVQGYPYNPEKAKELLAEAGYPNGFKTELKTEDSAAMVQAVQIIAQYLQEVGIECEITILSGADGNLSEAGWGKGLWLHGSSVYVSASMQMASMFRQGLTGHVLGLTTMERPDDVHEYLMKAMLANSPEEAVAACGEANRLLVDEHCIYDNIAEVATLFAENSYVHNSGIGESFYSVSTLWKCSIEK